MIAISLHDRGTLTLDLASDYRVYEIIHTWREDEQERSAPRAVVEVAGVAHVTRWPSAEALLRSIASKAVS